MSKQMSSFKEITDAMADVIEAPGYPEVCKEFDRLLEIMGNVDGHEGTALVLVAYFNIKGEK